MELNLSILQKVADGGLSPFVMHFPDQVARVFYIDSTTGKIMQAETDTPFGVWDTRVFDDPTLAYKIKSFLQAKSFYIPRELYFAYPTDNKKAEILYYDTIDKMFKPLTPDPGIQYPVVYSRFDTTFTGYGLAILDMAKNVKIKEVINGEFTLSFILPRNDPKWQYIQPDNFVKVQEQLFRVKTFDEERDTSGKILSNIQCEHVYYDSIDSKHIPYFEAIGQIPAQILATAFEGTRFTIGTVEVTAATDLWLDKTNPSEVAAKLIENVGGELVKDNWTIHLLNRRGNNYGVQFRVGKNVKSLKRNTNASEIITRLYPYGKDSLDISSVNSTAYIDSPIAVNYDRPKVGYIDYKDIEDPIELLATAQKEWSTTDKDGIDKPKVTYSCDIIELKKLKEYGYFETFGLGDFVRIIDDGIKCDTKQRIVSYEYYPFEPEQSKVDLANYEPRDYSKNSFGGMMTGFTQTQSSISKITTPQGTVNAGWLENIQDKLSTLFDGKLKQAVMHKMGDIWVDNPNSPTKAMGILADGFAIANSKTVTGEWDWKTFGTAEGFVADLINAGTLRAINIIGAIIKTADEGTDRLEMTTNGVVAKTADGKRNGFSLEKCIEEGFSNFFGNFFYVDDVLAGGLTMNMADGRLWLMTKGEYILKLKSAADMSIDAGNGKTIFIASSNAQNIHFGNGESITTFYGTVTGLENSGYAKTSDISNAISNEDMALRNWVTANFAPKT